MSPCRRTDLRPLYQVSAQFGSQMSNIDRPCARPVLQHLAQDLYHSQYSGEQALDRYILSEKVFSVVRQLGVFGQPATLQGCLCRNVTY